MEAVLHAMYKVTHIPEQAGDPLASVANAWSKLLPKGQVASLNTSFTVT
jgi:hypothetical protein